MPKAGRRLTTTPCMASLVSFAQTTIFSRPVSGGRVGISTKHPPSLMFLTSPRTRASEPCICSSAPNLHGTRWWCLRSLTFAAYGETGPRFPCSLDQRAATVLRNLDDWWSGELFADLHNRRLWLRPYAAVPLRYRRRQHRCHAASRRNAVSFIFRTSRNIPCGTLLIVSVERCASSGSVLCNFGHPIAALAEAHRSAAHRVWRNRFLPFGTHIESSYS